MNLEKHPVFKTIFVATHYFFQFEKILTDKEMFSSVRS